MKKSIVITRNLCKTYGKLSVLNQVDSEFSQGMIHSVVGENGSGKTTFLKILSGLMGPNSGTVEVFGKPPARFSLKEKQELQFLTEQSPMPLWMNLRQLERYYATLFYRWNKRIARQLQDEFELNLEVPVSKMSKGTVMKTRVLLALSSQPKILLMDEPFSGLDLKTRYNLKEKLIKYKKNGGTVIMATHTISDLENIVQSYLRLNCGSFCKLVSAESIKSDYLLVEVSKENVYKIVGKCLMNLEKGRFLKEDKSVLEIVLAKDEALELMKNNPQFVRLGSRPICAEDFILNYLG